MDAYHRPIVSQESEQSQGETKLGYIFDIQRFSINDGPGIRTTVFFKGCPLRCIWCDNPESQEQLPQLLYFESLCTKCYRCVEECPTGATKISPDGSIEIDRGLCQADGLCVEACPSEARVLSGRKMTVDEVVEIVRKDELFYRNSGGGITVSGGEPLMQPEFVYNLLRECKANNFHTTLDTCGYAQWDIMQQVLEYTDLVLYDIKHMDSAEHRRQTGVDNELILSNLEKIKMNETRVWLRCPVIPGFNDSESEIEKVAKFALSLKVEKISLLPYFKYGEQKYEYLGRSYSLKKVSPPRTKSGDKKISVIKYSRAELTFGVK